MWPRIARHERQAMGPRALRYLGRVRRVLIGLAVAGLPLLAWFGRDRGWPGTTGALSVALFLSIAINLAVAALFGFTLRNGGDPLVARFARRERGGELDPGLARYCRRLTALWTGYLLGLAGIGVAIAVRGSEALWLWWSGVANYVLIAALFVGENVFRRFRFPDRRHASPFAQLRNVIEVLAKLRA